MTPYRSAVLSLFCVFYSFIVDAQKTSFAKTNFAKADSIAERYASHSLYDIKGLADKLTGALRTEPEKFRAIYKWVCSNIEVDYRLVEQNRRKRLKLSGDQLKKWNEQFNRDVFATLLKDRRTVCTGYAYLIRELAYHAGLQCEIIYGHARPGGVTSCEGRPVNHSWNKIYLNGKPYYCDPTWSSGYFCVQTNTFVHRYDDRYFLADAEFFLSEHCHESGSRLCSF